MGIGVLSDGSFWHLLLFSATWQHLGEEKAPSSTHLITKGSLLPGWGGPSEVTGSLFCRPMRALPSPVPFTSHIAGKALSSPQTPARGLGPTQSRFPRVLWGWVTSPLAGLS